MKLSPLYSFALWLALFTLSCAQPKALTSDADITAPRSLAETEFEERLLDTLQVTARRKDPSADAETYALPTYNPSYTRRNDLLHTKLDLRFDWDKEQVLGKATLSVKPLFYPVSEITLDAKGFDFHQVRFAGADKDLEYAYDGKHVTIQLGRAFTRDEVYTLFIDYTATPKGDDGSAAITSNQGLFFIKPSPDDPEKPYQIWTQGETEWNSRWFPTIDRPNERCTQELSLTVADNFKTLSNGLLVSSRKNTDGTRTDYWKLDLPHAPYLFMIAVGEFAVVKDQWGGIPVEYYVEPEFEQDARAIFPYTVEMLDFFSKKLGVKYPWPKYSQVVVRDYVSGAMENTTAVIFGEFMQRPRRELIDERTNEKIVAHEMFHHWFGDLVTCESWANLTMNEGFANYSEYLWLEHKYGADEADFHLLQDWSGYFSEARNKIRPIIDFGYENKEDMFDAHSYNKGGAVLHMLRDYVGDEAFWAALREYLTDHAYTAVEAHHLRLAFEAVTGEDLNWFFNQWFFREGHPRLNVTYGYDSEEGVATVSVEQTQDPDEMPPIFELPAAIDIYLGEGEKQRHQVRVNQRRQTFSFPVQQQPRLINFDANKVLLAESEDNKTEEELIFQYFNAPRFYDRLEALQHLSSRDNPEARKVFQAALNDPFWLMRSFALARVDPNEGQIAALLRGMALNDPHSQVRASALGQIAEIDDPAGLEIAKQIIQTDSAYNVIAAALELLTQRDPAAALEYAGKLENERSADLLEAISNIYAESGDAKYLPFFRDNLNKIDGFQALSFYTNYHTLILDAGDEAAAQQTAEELRNIALNTGQSPWRRLAAMKSLNDMRNEFQGRARETSAPADKARLEELVLQISKYMEQVKVTEPNAQLRGMYQQLQLMEGADE